MRFTWWTYRVATRRAFRREYEAFAAQLAANGPDPWIRAMLFSNALFNRRKRR